MRTKKARVGPPTVLLSCATCLVVAVVKCQIVTSIVKSVCASEPGDTYGDAVHWCYPGQAECGSVAVVESTYIIHDGVISCVKVSLV